MTIDIPAITTEQMKEVDRLMIAEYGIQLIQMMENAGRNLADLAIRMVQNNPAGSRIVVLVGNGNNGGGGLVAARHLHNRGASVSVIHATDGDLKEIPQRQWNILMASGIQISTGMNLGEADLILDAIIGYGLNGRPREPVKMWINAMNRSGRSILSIDAPSGLDTSTGMAWDPCVVASATLTLALPKTGLMSSRSREFVGQLFLADISVPPGLYKRLGLSVGRIFSDTAIVQIY